MEFKNTVPVIQDDFQNKMFHKKAILVLTDYCEFFLAVVQYLNLFVKYFVVKYIY